MYFQLKMPENAYQKIYRRNQTISQGPLIILDVKLLTEG